jgi:tRNA pseudouridine55 synthase
LNRLFVAYKPTGLSSNQFLGRLKRKYGTRKAGYSGTLDPFAKGVLIVALGSHTRLFRFLDKVPKTYRATLWLGAHSDTLDIEAIEQIDALPPFSLDQVTSAVSSLEGELEYHPPIFSAKKIDGRRAYDLAREGKEVVLNTIHSTIYEMKLLHYCHPFVTFEATVSEGTYIRSLGRLIAQKLGTTGSLSALERLREGQFGYNGEQALDIRASLALPQNRYTGDSENILFGRPLILADIERKDDGEYWIDNGDTISIIKIEHGTITYLMNKVELC